jgi:PAS domain S-box-containing protein
MRLWIAGAAVYAALVLCGVFVLHPGSGVAQTFGDVAIMLAAVIACVSCFSASRRRGPNARAWLFMCVATAVWASAQALWTFFGITLDHHYPFPSLADAGFIGYSIPVIIGLVAFQGSRSSGVALLRTVLDAAVIATATLFVSWATVLGPLYRTDSQSTLGRLTTLGYPIVDVVITSLVLVLAMHSVPGQRRSWLILGAGLLILTFSDSAFVHLTLDGVIGLDGTPMAVGWVLAFLMIALAAATPHGAGSRKNGRPYTLALEMLPYVPVSAAAVLAFSNAVFDPFLVFSGLIVVVLVFVRQVLIVYENVTLTRDLEEKVAKRTAENEGLAAIVNSSGDAILSLDTQGKITSWNPGAEASFGYTPEEVIGRHGTMFMTEQRRDAELAEVKALIEKGESFSYETYRVRKDGSIVPVALTASPIRGVDGIRGVGIIAQDITERRATEVALLKAREEALESSRLKSEFLATMSHEIRTPMNGVIGLTTLLLDTPLNQTQRHYAEGAQGAGQALLTLMNDILDFSKLEAGKVELEIGPFDPRKLVEDVAGLLSESAHGKGLDLITHCSPDVAETLVGDIGRIRQVLLNLASNAVKFTAAGEVEISVSVPDHARAQGWVRFEVRDTGIGIDEADHVRLFDSFSQADASTTRRYGGTGLGLAISRRLTQRMDGEIGVISRLGEGSTFWFALPMATSPGRSRDTSSIATVEHAASNLRHAGHTSPGLVLVVEDNEVNQLVAREMVTKLGYQVGLATNGAEAVAAVVGTSYQAVLMDCHMPVMDGFEATAAIRRLPGVASRVPIIAMTAGAYDEDRRRCLDAGMDDFLAKPVDLSDLKGMLERWVRDGTLSQPHRDEPAMGPAMPALVPDRPTLDQARLDLFRNLGPADGRGLLADAAFAFRSEVPASLAALDLAIVQNDDGGLKRAAHKLKGGAASIGAAGAAALCAQLEGLAHAGGEGRSRELIGRLETELAKVDAALDRALEGS